MAGSLLVAVLFVEGSLWLFAPLTSHEWLRWVPDGHVRGRAAPNQVLRTGNGYEIRINTLGFRGPDYPLRAAEGMLRLAVFGGSSTFGLDAKGINGTWPGRLQRILAEKMHMPVEVINLALPGFDSRTSKLNYLLTGREVHPHVVLMYHTWNDLKRFRALEHSPGLFTRPARNKSWWKRLARETQLARRGARIVRRFREQAIENTYVSLAKTEADESRPVSAEAFAWSRQNFLDFAAFAHADGVLPVLVSQATIAHPANLDKMDYRLKIRVDYVRMTMPILCSTWEEMSRIIDSAARQSGAVFVDGHHAVPPDLEHLRDHVHLTSLGRAALAQVIAEVLLNDERFMTVAQRVRGQVPAGDRSLP